MDGVPKELLRAAYVRKPIYLLKVPMHFALWAACGFVLYEVQGSPYAVPVGLACSVLIACLIRGLGAVAHDSVHGNVSRSKLLSYVFGLLCWSPTGMSYTIYSNYHLHHHRIANTYADVDNFVVTDYTRNPFLAKVLLLGVYTIGYPLYFMFQMLRYTKRLTPLLFVRMHLELAGIFGLVYLAYVKMPLYVFFFLFGLPFIFGAFLASVTSMIEHYDMPATDDDAYSSRTYGTAASFTNFLWNNVTFHNEHHKYPGIPFYNLRSFHEAAYPYYDEQVKAAVHRSIWPLALHLWGRVLKVDLAKLEERYRGVDREAELGRVMAMPGIPSEAV
jgi:fatty acid desaturase